MPVDRDQVRRNLIALIQFQNMRRGEYGELLLAVWFGIESQADDVHLLEVYEQFAAEDGAEQSLLRFPGMANMWLPGLYMIHALSRREFEKQLTDPSELIERIRAQLSEGRAEILWPVPPGELGSLLQISP